jgi:phosphatidylserine decarboxylase
MIRYALTGALLAFATALPLAWKWRLGMLRAGSALAVMTFVAAGITATAGGGLGRFSMAATAYLLTLVLAATAVAFRFYRDPEREPPGADDVIVSPADGEVLYIRESRGGSLPVSTKRGRPYSLRELTKTDFAHEDAVVVGIGLSLLDVHVNRAPMAGEVRLLRRFRGRFGSLRRPEMVFENERATVVLERGDLEVAVVMIASRLVRRIVTWIAEGERVAIGQRIGIIRFGSQVDLVLPARDDLQMRVQVGDRLRAGESTIACLSLQSGDRRGAEASSTTSERARHRAGAAGGGN